ncbi:MAG: glutamine--tRNA ligase/YqeY domain fusion protein [Planctomycetes bacterium]|nr:glutamine--tRNA ligase/YqeY domain fusion protein [Planctomycetota bacterium]
MSHLEPKEHLDFIRQAVQRDRDAGKHGGRVHLRFPPEPNGYLHVGHAKSICLNFGIAQQFGGKCNLRFDDTNPLAEEQEYVDAIMDDIRWLGFQWDELHFASDWFERLWSDCTRLVAAGKAYVDQLDPKRLRELRGDWFQPGADSPYRDRPVAENLALLERIRAGEFADGEYVIRARIDMAHPNLNLRDPAMYRIRHAHHHRTGDRWCVYPMYDWAHGQNDSYEGITHSICTLEFEDHRPLYEWFIQNLGIHAPQQIEFARLNLTYTVLSKRKLLQLVKEKLVDGWDDPRMPTLRGMRRRGFTPQALRAFCEHIGISKFNSVHEIELLEHFLREDLNRVCPRRMAVIDPIELVITDWPAGVVDLVDALNNPEDQTAGTRKVPFTGRLWVERDDFRDPAPKKWFRLAIGQEVRLRYGYFVTVNAVERDAEGRIVRLLATHDPKTRGGDSPDGRKVRGTIHWVAQQHAVDAELRLYDRLFAVADPNDVPPGKDWKEFLDPNSLEVRRGCKLEAALANVEPGAQYQFERSGYFIADAKDCRPGALVFNRTVALKDSWAKLEKKLGADASRDG